MAGAVSSQVSQPHITLQLIKVLVTERERIPRLGYTLDSRDSPFD
jgi:hypothetical protein